LRNNLKKTLVEIFLTLGLAALIFGVLHFTVQHSIVEGSSMLPGLENGQRLIVNKAAFLVSSPQRGEVVIIHPPVAPGSQWVKRIIGLPGDTIRVEKGTVYVNDVPLKEPYIKESPHYSMASLKVPAGNYFVMGDNRNNSSDSRGGWTIGLKDIVGKAWLVTWPPSDIGLAPNYALPSG
jgi:signal peptidase I